MSFTEFIGSLDRSGARNLTQAEPFQQYLSASQGSQVARPVTRPVMPGGQQSQPRRMRQPSQAQIQQALDPRATEGLQLARSQHQSAEQLMQSLGLESDGGEPATGFLNAAFRAIDYPRALTFNAFRAMLDPEMGFDEFRQALDDRGDGRREGFGDLSGLVVQEDDSNVTRAWKMGAAFLGDVVTDPLMLVSFGAIPAGKKLGSAAVYHAIRKRARDLPEEVLQRMQGDALKAQVRIGAQRQGANLSDEAAAQAAKRLEGVAPDDLAGYMAAEAYNLRGATGLNEFLTKYGSEATELWRSLPTDMRGGLRIRVPFAREEQVRKTISIAGGGGQLAKALGMGPLVSKSHQLRNMVRGSQAGRALNTALNGFYGDLYGDMASQLIRQGSENISGVTWAMWKSADTAARTADKTRKGIMQMGDETAAKVGYQLNRAGSKDDVDEAWKAFNRYASNPEELDRLVPGTGLSMDELGRHFAEVGDEAAELTRNEIMGLWGASEYHFLMRRLATEAKAAGVDMGHLNDYLPLQLTELAREGLAARKVGLGKRAGRMFGGDDPARAREMGFEFRMVTDEDDITRVVLHPLTPEQANARAHNRAAAGGQPVDAMSAFFEEDLGIMLTRYTQALSHMASEAKFSQLIRKSGLISDADKEFIPKLRPKTLHEGEEHIEKALDLLRRIDAADGETAGTELRQAIHEILDNSEALQRTITRSIQADDITDAQRVDMAGDIIRTMDQWLDRLPSAGEADKLLRQAQKEFTAAQSKVRKASRPEVIAGPEGRALHELGLTPVDVTDVPLRKIPPELDLTFAPAALTDAIHKFYRLQGKPGQSLMDKWYRPYHAMFKMTATIGRGPGFHIRNAWGGTINNMLYGATPEDAWTMSKIVGRMSKAGKQARKEVASETPAPAREGRRIRNSHEFQVKVNERTEQILEKSLRDIQITPEMDGWEFYRAMIDQEDILWGRRQGRGFEGFGTDYVEPGGRVGSRTMVSRSASGERMSVRYPGRKWDDLSAAQKGVEKLDNFWWIRFNANAAEMTEAYLRGTAFLHGMRKYRDPETARLGTLITQFDYHDLSDIERVWLRGTLLPFYTWTRNNIPFQFRSLMQNPGRMNALNRMVANAENAFGDQDADVLPEWMKTRFGFVSKFEFGGNPLMFGVESPAQDLNEFFKVRGLVPSIEGTARALGSAMNPALAIPMQIGWGTEFFTGATLSETDQRLAPRWYQALPNRIAPTWIDPKTGDVMGDARLIVAGPGAVPWLGQGEKLISIMQAMGGSESAYPEGRNRVMTDAIRQFFPVVTAGTLTPQGESGELFQRTRRLRSQAARQGDPEEYAMVRQLQEMGLNLEQIAHVMEARRARQER